MADSLTFDRVTLTFKVQSKNVRGRAPRRPVVLNPLGRKRVLHFTIPRKGSWRFKWKYVAKAGAFSARHDNGYVYTLPYPPGKSYVVSQGFNGTFTHRGASRYAIDFALPENSEVVATRGGTVINVREDSEINGQRDDANYVWISHSDGTVGAYAHLVHNGVLVSAGQQVQPGQVIALSGNTGYSRGPHLHFHVFTKVKKGRGYKTFPIVFRTADGKATTLRKGRTYRAP